MDAALYRSDLRVADGNNPYNEHVAIGDASRGLLSGSGDCHSRSADCPGVGLAVAVGLYSRCGNLYGRAADVRMDLTAVSGGAKVGTGLSARHPFDSAAFSAPADCACNYFGPSMARQG